MPSGAKTRITSVKRIADSMPRGGECLVEIYGKRLGRKIDLDDEPLTVGRDPENHVVIETDSVSRRHARIEPYNAEWYLVDLDSTNGTYLNDKMVVRARLESGDLIKIGDTIFKFLSGGNLESAYHEEIYRMTIQDGLTQIANKRYMADFLDKEFARARRYDRNLALVLFDIDHFKRINDEYGHLTGDFVLKELARVVSRRVRREELFARYGGEEFAVVLPEATRSGARQFTESVRRLIEGHRFTFEGSVIPVTISAGIGHLVDGAKTPTDLIRIADERLYEAKHQGRNRVVD